MSYFTPDIKDNPINKINPSLVTEATLSSMIKSQFSWLGTQQFYEIEAGEVKKVFKCLARDLTGLAMSPSSE